jgi:hypothetical protein
MRYHIDDYYNDFLKKDMKSAKNDAERDLIYRAYEIACEIDDINLDIHSEKDYNNSRCLLDRLWSEWWDDIRHKLHLGEYLNVASCISGRYESADENLELYLYS